MYQFSTKQGKKFYTFYSPSEIINFYCFDCFDNFGNSKVVETKEINYSSFKYEKCFCEYENQ